METNNDHPSGLKQELTALPPVRSAPSTEINLIDLMIVLARRKKLVIGLPMLVAALSVAISLALPNVYSATVKLLPPQQAQSGASALLAQLGGAAGGLAAGIAGVTGVAGSCICVVGGVVVVAGSVVVWAET